MFRIYTKLGGQEATLEVIERRLNWRPSPHAVRKWQANKAISPRVAMALVEECRERGIRVDPIADFRAPHDKGAAA